MAKLIKSNYAEHTEYIGCPHMTDEEAERSITTGYNSLAIPADPNWEKALVLCEQCRALAENAILREFLLPRQGSNADGLAASLRGAELRWGSRRDS